MNRILLARTRINSGYGNITVNNPMNAHLIDQRGVNRVNQPNQPNQDIKRSQFVSN